MPVDPLLAPLLAVYPVPPAVVDDFPEFRAASREGADALVSQLAEPGPEVRDIQDISIPVESGEIILRVYHPLSQGPHPIHLFIHGGGWMIGSVHDLAYETACRERTALADYVTVSVNYRKAPEHKFPTALNDCYAALKWVAAHADDLDARADRIVVGGQSAGGNLAAALCLKVRDEGGPHIALQLLEVPVLDLTYAHPSHQLYGTGYALSTEEMHLARGSYLRQRDDVTNPYVSPLLAEDLRGLPAAHIMAAEYDVLHDEAEVYAQRLDDAGVPVTYSHQPGHVHVSAAATALMPAARLWREEVIAVLKRGAGS